MTVPARILDRMRRASQGEGRGAGGRGAHRAGDGRRSAGTGARDPGRGADGSDACGAGGDRGGAGPGPRAGLAVTLSGAKGACPRSWPLRCAQREQGVLPRIILPRPDGLRPLSRSASPMQDLRSRSRPHRPDGRRDHVPRRGARLRRERGPAARARDGRGGAVPPRPHPEVLRARTHGQSRSPSSSAGAGGTIFMAVLAIEELARVDASAAIYVDVHNTLVNNALLRWGNEEQQARYLPRLTTDLLGAFALSEPGSGSDAFALETKAERKGERLGAHRPEVLDHQRRRGRALHRLRQHRLLQGLQGHHRRSSSSGTSPASRVGKKENKLGIRASSTTELILEQLRGARRERARPGRARATRSRSRR